MLHPEEVEWRVGCGVFQHGVAKHLVVTDEDKVELFSVSAAGRDVSYIVKRLINLHNQDLSMFSRGGLACVMFIVGLALGYFCGWLDYV